MEINRAKIEFLKRRCEKEVKINESNSKQFAS